MIITNIMPTVIKRSNTNHHAVRYRVEEQASFEDSLFVTHVFVLYTGVNEYTIMVPVK